MSTQQPRLRAGIYGNIIIGDPETSYVCMHLPHETSPLFTDHGSTCYGGGAKAISVFRDGGLLVVKKANTRRQAVEPQAVSGESEASSCKQGEHQIWPGDASHQLKQRVMLGLSNTLSPSLIFAAVCVCFDEPTRMASRIFIEWSHLLAKSECFIDI
jgi:hypothetical protein